MKFPEDFEAKRHPFIMGAMQWLLKDDEDNIIVSIVGGGRGLYGDGVTTFEMWDYSQDAPVGWQSKEEINDYLSFIDTIKSL